jgi:peptidoglycan/xylan/chitin deacetylase (PgdA/CDA1 family)
VPLLDWESLRCIAARGHEIGGHTLTHPDLAALPPDRLDGEIAGSRRRILETGLPCVHFAWPFGRFARCTPEVAAHVFRAGYESCASAERGAHASVPSRASPACIHRTIVGPGETARSVRARMALAAATSAISDDGWPRGWRESIISSTTVRQ